MPPRVERIVILSRYTGLVGPPSGDQVMYTTPLNTRDYARADLSSWKGSHSGTLAMALEGSPDLVSWISLGSISLASGQESTTSFATLDWEWVRMKITLTSGPSVTCWVVGEFVTRE